MLVVDAERGSIGKVRDRCCKCMLSRRFTRLVLDFRLGMTVCILILECRSLLTCLPINALPMVQVQRYQRVAAFASCTLPDRA